MTKFPVSANWVRERNLGDVIEPGVIDDQDLLRVHSSAYVQSIRTGHYNDATKLRLGLPWSAQLSERSHRATAGTLRAAHAAMQDGIAANLAGGTHHAFPDRGEGFCVFNDVAVAIRSLQASEPWYRFMVIDLDAHQGNGTHFIFRSDPNVFTYSVHVGRNYPSKKEPGTLDVELTRYAGADEYFTRVRDTLPRALGEFEPDLVFYIAGADVHEDDQFGQMKLSTADMRERDRYTIDLCRDARVPTTVVYGGGYNRTPDMTAWLHVQTIDVASQRLARENATRSGGVLAS